jgi:hypothetical protein
VDATNYGVIPCTKDSQYGMKVKSSIKHARFQDTLVHKFISSTANYYQAL